MVEIFSLHGIQCRPFLKDLANLRILVFREFPYLYEGDREYEERYLHDYFASPDSVLVIARDPDLNKIVGASTAMPLRMADPAFQSTVSNARMNPQAIYYFGESVLLREYRGNGIGHRFFDHREAVARNRGFQTTAFCAVNRPHNHPHRPTNHHPHDEFWRKRGYTHHPEIKTCLHWREPGEPAETPHELSFWMRDFP